MSSYHISFDWSGVVSEEIVRATAGIEDAASLCLLNSVHVGRTCWEAHGLDFRQINQYDPDSNVLSAQSSQTYPRHAVSKRSAGLEQQLRLPIIRA